MRLISGIPPWVSMYYEKIEEKNREESGRPFSELQSICIRWGKL